MINPKAEAYKYRITKEQILKRWPDIDDETLADTLEGQTNLIQVMTTILNAINERQIVVDGIKEAQSRLDQRKSRNALAIENLKELMGEILIQSGERRITLPEATISMVNERQKVIVIDAESLPNEYVRITKEPDKTAIKQALDNGKMVMGAILSNGGSTMRINRK